MNEIALFQQQHKQEVISQSQNENSHFSHLQANVSSDEVQSFRSGSLLKIYSAARHRSS